MSNNERLVWAAAFAAAMNEIDFEDDTPGQASELAGRACTRAYAAVLAFRRMSEITPTPSNPALDMLRDMAGLTN